MVGKKKVSEDYIQDSILSREFKTHWTEQYHSDKWIYIYPTKIHVNDKNEVQDKGSKEMRWRTPEVDKSCQ